MPRAVLCLARALSRGDSHELLEMAQFARGLAIQVSYRAVCGELLVNDHAALVYSRLDRPRASPPRVLAGMALATAIGIALFVVSNTLLLVPVCGLLRLAGASSDVLAATALGRPFSG